MLNLCFSLLLAYLLGSCSGAILICRAYGLTDPRTVGSHNPGATNVRRIGGMSIALQVFFFDALKGVLAVLIARYFHLGAFALSLTALIAVIGHLFPVFHRFQGGKGVATCLGAIIAIHWLYAVCFGLTWLVVYKLKGYSSLASLCATASLPLLALYVNIAHFPAFCLIFLSILWSHRGNLQRLAEGQETPPTSI